jgi:hypothetical protein
VLQVRFAQLEAATAGGDGGGVRKDGRDGDYGGDDRNGYNGSGRNIGNSGNRHEGVGNGCHDDGNMDEGGDDAAAGFLHDVGGGGYAGVGYGAGRGGRRRRWATVSRIKPAS